MVATRASVTLPRGMSSTILPNVSASIGKTPLIQLNRITAGAGGRVLVKAEFMNPLASLKDRVGLAMIVAAERTGKLKPDAVVIEPTSGNMGIALAGVCAQRGYKLVLTMPETMSLERRVLLRLLGAEVVLTPGPEGMPGAIQRAKELLAEYGERGFMPQQFENPANPEAHRCTTAEEIWSGTGGEIDAFVAGVGTGGTITGVGEVLKARRPSVKIVAVEPAGSAVLSGGKPGRNVIQGLGAGFIPKNLNRAILDEVIAVTDNDALETARSLASQEGLLCGISTGATVWAALQLARRQEFFGKTIVTIGASCGERYLSTALADRARADVSV